MAVNATVAMWDNLGHREQICEVVNGGKSEGMLPDVASFGGFGQDERPPLCRLLCRPRFISPVLTRNGYSKVSMPGVGSLNSSFR